MRDGELETCDREPIHVPGSIQPHGVLLVVDLNSGAVIQSAGDTKALLGVSCTVGHPAERCLRIPFADLLRRLPSTPGQKPVFLGSILASERAPELVVRGQLMRDAIVVEIEPSSWPHPAAETITGIREGAEKIALADDLLDACRIAASEVARVSGYDRVMIYQFLPDGSGSVVAEERDEHLPSLLNHRFPASDVPEQARQLYLRNPIRVVPDVHYTPALMTPALHPRSGQPLDMSYCALRSISPVHIRYLKNMGVGASMSVSLVREGKLWGLIACHHSSARLVPLEAQEICAHVAQILSQKIAAYDDTRVFRQVAELSEAREHFLRFLRESDGPANSLFEKSFELLTVVPADGVAVLGSDRIAMLGSIPPEAQLRKLGEFALRNAADLGVFATDCIEERFPDVVDMSDAASGMLAVIAPGAEPITLIWFRAAQIEEINWAGNPHEAITIANRPGALTPRRSFATWRETVRGRSKPWTPAEIDSGRTFAARAGVLIQQQQIRDLNQLLQEAAIKLETLATTDPLTDLPNRRALDDRLVLESERIGETQGSLAFLAIDVDFFKQYNDEFGHPAGDKCLKQVAAALRAACRANDMAARTGGEEFCMLLPDTDNKAALGIAEALRSAIEGRLIANPAGEAGAVTVSIGVATMGPGAAENLESLQREADEALYRAKRDGRNRVACAAYPE